MITRPARLLGLLLGVLLLVSAPVTAAQPKGKSDVAAARAHYTKGLELYDEQAYDAALIEFQRAYDIAPAFKILYNLGLVHRQLNDYAGALRSFRQYLEEGGTKVEPKRRDAVEAEIKKLEGRVAQLEIVANVEDAEVLIDDLEVGETPLERPVLVNAGKRKVTIAKSGYVPVTRVVVVAGGDTKKLELELRSGTAPPPAQSGSSAGGTSKPEKATKPAPADQEPKRKIPWVWWGVTGGLAAGTAVAGVLALGAQRDLDDKKAAPAKKQELDDAASKTRTLAIVTDVLLGCTVVAGAYSAYLTFGPQKEQPPTQARLRVGVGPGQLSLGGDF